MRGTSDDATGVVSCERFNSEFTFSFRTCPIGDGDMEERASGITIFSSIGIFSLTPFSSSRYQSLNRETSPS